MQEVSELQEGSHLDGYELLRPIGSGGFGQVWLCRNLSTREFRALKWIPCTSGSHLDQELKALIIYRDGLLRAPSRYLLPIEHVRLIESGLFYTMPLADGPEGLQPEMPEWFPITLSTLIEGHEAHGSWFSSSEIRKIISNILDAAHSLSQAGIVHRDIKPDNILLFQGQPCLGDYGLSTVDTAQITRKGTPVYLAPSWYIESSGNPDMWGCACLLYVLLTGNAPDKMGKASFIWPPLGEASLSEEEKAEWRRLHQIVHRATADNPEDRYLGFDRFAAGVLGSSTPVSPAPTFPPPQRKPYYRRVVIFSLSLLAALGVTWGVASYLFEAFSPFAQQAKKVESMIYDYEKAFGNPNSPQFPSVEEPQKALDALRPLKILNESDSVRILSTLKDVRAFLVKNSGMLTASKASDGILTPPEAVEIRKAIQTLKESATSPRQKNTAQTLSTNFEMIKNKPTGRIMNSLTAASVDFITLKTSYSLIWEKAYVEARDSDGPQKAALLEQLNALRLK